MLHLECPFDTLIEVSKAMLGRKNDEICPAIGGGGAPPATCTVVMKPYVVKKCRAKRMCDIAVPAVPSDAVSQCSQILKSVYLEVTHSCNSK